MRAVTLAPGQGEGGLQRHARQQGGALVQGLRAFGAGIGFGQRLQALDAHPHDNGGGEGIAGFVGQFDAVAGFSKWTPDQLEVLRNSDG